MMGAAFMEIWGKRAGWWSKFRSSGPSAASLEITIALVYVNTTSTTQRLFAYISKRLNAPNVGGSR